MVLELLVPSFELCIYSSISYWFSRIRGRYGESQVFMYSLSFVFFRPLDEWGSITVDHRELLDGGSLWRVTFDDYSLVARAGGTPPFNASRGSITNGAVSVERVFNAASPVVHRVLVAALSTLDSTSSFELSLENVVTRRITVDESAYYLQNVSLVAAALYVGQFYIPRVTRYILYVLRP